MMAWRAFLARTVAAGAIVGGFVMGAVVIGVKLAGADPGGPPTRNWFTFAGVLNTPDGRVMTSPTMLRFVFHRMGMPDCTPTVVRAEPNSRGAFSVPVPIDSCGSTFFNGTDISYDVYVDGEDAAVASDAAITPVPYARFADQAGVNNDCPAGYSRGTLTTDTPGIVCVRNVALGATTLRDEVVKVGSGAATFWVDRYEASVIEVSTGMQRGTATRSGGGTDDIPATGLTRSGQRPRGVPPPAMAVSGAGMPTVNVTWFQAAEACRAAGKHLIARSEWFAAASGTIDDSTCNVSSSGARAAAASNACVSASGVHDMIGNLWEWTDEWYAGVADGSSTYAALPSPSTTWPERSLYNDDRTWNIASSALTGVPAAGEMPQPGTPSATLRGGAFQDGPYAGVFSMGLHLAPSRSFGAGGFRCVISR